MARIDTLGGRPSFPCSIDRDCVERNMMWLFLAPYEFLSYIKARWDERRKCPSGLIGQGSPKEHESEGQTTFFLINKIRAVTGDVGIIYICLLPVCHS